MTMITETPTPEPSAVDLGLESGEKPRSMFSRGWEVFAENKLALASLAFLVFAVCFAFLAPFVYHSNTSAVDITAFTQPPGAGHPLGTDQQGFDELGELMKATQSSLEVGLAAGLIAALLGALYGAVSGYVGGWVDALMMRIIDALMSFPIIFALIYINTVYGRSQLTLIV